jgi:hypothetical protein
VPGAAALPTPTITVRPTLGFTCTMLPPQCPQGDLTIVSAPPNCPTVQACVTRFPGCPPPWSHPLICRSALECRTQPQFGCPVLSAPPRCPTVQACPSRVIFCGFGGG